MSIEQGFCTSFLPEVLNGYHAFGTPPARSATPDVFKLALYGSSASLGPTTTVYTSSGEVPNTGTYTAGGATLTISTTPTIGSGSVAYMGIATVTFTGVTMTAYGALMYNSSQGNRAVAVLNFGSAKVATNQTFSVTFPVANPISSLIRVRIGQVDE